MTFSSMFMVVREMQRSGRGCKGEDILMLHGLLHCCRQCQEKESLAGTLLYFILKIWSLST